MPVVQPKIKFKKERKKKEFHSKNLQKAKFQRGKPSLEIPFAPKLTANLEESALRPSSCCDGLKGGRERGRIKGKPSFLPKTGSLIPHIFKQRHPQNKVNQKKTQP